MKNVALPQKVDHFAANVEKVAPGNITGLADEILLIADAIVLRRAANDNIIGDDAVLRRQRRDIGRAGLRRREGDEQVVRAINEGVKRDHGALYYTETIDDDVKPGKVTSFPQSVKLKPNETVMFSWIVFKSRSQRDRVNAKVMKDPRLAKMMDPKAMPFDAKRMFWGGFKTLVEL